MKVPWELQRTAHVVQERCQPEGLPVRLSRDPEGTKVFGERYHLLDQGATPGEQPVPIQA